MNTVVKSTLALTALIGAFYLSISYRYGDPGWRLEFSAKEAEARPEKGSSYDLRQLAILNRAVVNIKENYVDPSRINERKMIGAAMEEVQRAIAELLVEVDKDSEDVPSRITVRVNAAEQSFDLQDVGDLWQLSFKFKDIFSFIQQNLQHHDKLQDIEYAAINGMLSTLDPHSVLLRPEDYREMKLSTRGKFGGLGIVISVRDGQLTVVNPIDDTPASRAGLKAGDKVVQIGFDSTVNMALSDAVDMLRGAPNTSVTIWVSREGWAKPRKFVLERADIKVKSVTYKQLPDAVGLVRVRNFQNTTFNELKNALKKMGKKTPLKGLVLDLRGNPGGLLDQAIKMSDLFIESGPLVTTVGYGNRIREPKMATRKNTQGFPVVVLTSNSSASASEIVAGALKNHKRALIIGQQTFGKGSVQVIYDNKDDSALKLTIAQYLTPGDISIQSVGIVPDIATYPVVLTDTETDLHRSEEFKGGEKDLPSHLDHASSEISKAAKPVHRVRYLRDEALHKKVMENPNTIIEDFEIELAQRIIVSTAAGHRDGMLTDAMPVLDAVTAQQQKAIEDALDGRGVDWRVLATTGTPKAQVELTLDSPEPIKAGSTVTLQAKVTNVGDGPYVRLRAISRSENPLFEGHELLFGNIPPGESRTWKTPVKVPKSALTRRDVVKLEFKVGVDVKSENADRAQAKGLDLAEAPRPQPAEIKIAVEQLPRPRFAMTYLIDDAQQGNGDGLLQRGEQAELLVDIVNVGEGVSTALLGTLRDDGQSGRRGIFIKRGRIKAGGTDGEPVSLAPGEKTRLRFSFKVKADSPDNVPVQVSAMDAEIREITSEKLILAPVDADTRSAPVSARLKAKDGVVQLSGVRGDGGHIIGTAASARADAKLGDWYRVPLEEKSSKDSTLYGWVRADQVSTDAAQGASAITRVSPVGPPVITFDEQREAHTDAMTLQGNVSSGNVVKDLLVYVNNRKVFFKSNAANKAAHDTLDFSVRVPLDKGVNTITVVAREDNELLSRRTLIVNRD